MAGTIGITTIGGTSGGPTASNWGVEATIGSALRYTASAGDTVTQVAVYCNGSAAAGASAQVAIYVWNGSNGPGAQVGSAVTVNMQGASAGWRTASASIALTAGVTYVVAIDYYTGSSGFNIAYNPSYGSGTVCGWNSQTGFATPWVNPPSYTGTEGISFYATVSSGSPTLAPANLDAGATIGAAGALTQHQVLSVANLASSARLGAAQSGPRVPTSTSGRKVLDQHGDVFLLHTMSSWGLYILSTDADITQALEDCATNHFNAVTVWIGGGQTGSGWPTYNDGRGRAFWSSTPWASSLGTGWNTIDWIVAECARLGMVAVLSLNAWAAGTDMEAASNAQMQTAGAAVATRYAAATNIQWHVMFDDAPGTTHTPASTRGQRIEAFFQGVESVESGARPVRWMEPARTDSVYATGWTATTYFHPINGWYSYDNDAVDIVDASYAEAAIPTGDPEPPYDGSTHYTGDMGQQLRERVYSSFIRGAQYLQHGQEDFWRFGASGAGFTESLTWDQVVSHDHTIEQRYANDLIDTYCADPTWAPSSLITTGVGSGDTKAAGGNSDTAALAYFPNNRTIVVDTTVIAGTDNVRLRWFDPVAGTYSSIATDEAQNASRSVTLPAARGDGTRDFVLVVDRAVVILAPNDLGAGATIGAAGTLTQHQALAVANVAAGATVTAGALVQHQVLAVAGLAAGATIAAAQLTQHQVLSAVSLSAAATIEAAPLTQHQVLTVANLAAGATISAAGGLTQHQVLTVAGLAAAASLEAVVLGVAGQIAPANLGAGATIAAVTLTQHQVLTVQGLSAGATVGAVTLDGGNVALVVAGLTAAATIAAVAVVQHHVLTVDGLTAASRLDATDNTIYPANSSVRWNTPAIAVRWNSPSVLVAWEN